MSEMLEKMKAAFEKGDKPVSFYFPLLNITMRNVPESLIEEAKESARKDFLSDIFWIFFIASKGISKTPLVEQYEDVYRKLNGKDCGYDWKTLLTDELLRGQAFGL